MLEPLTPTMEQEAAITAMVNEPTRACLQASALGTGKTLVATEAGLRLGAKVIVISAPLHTRYGWYDTIMRQTAYKANFQWVNNKNKAGRQAKANLEWGVPGWYFIGRELARLTDWTGITPDLMIHDEVHNLNSRFSRGFKTMKNLKAGYTIAQSATWFGSSFDGAWAITRLLWPELIDKSFWRWVSNYCQTEYDHFAPQNKRIVGEKNPGEFVDSLPLYINLESQQGEPEIIPVYVDLSVHQRKLYRQMEENSISWLQDNPMIAELPIVQRIRLRQLTLAEATVDGETGEVDFPADARSTKFDALKEMLADMPDEQVVVVTDSAKYARWVAERLPSAFAWTGAASQGDRELAKADFLANKIRVIVATHPSISEGTDSLQHNCHVMIELSAHDSPLQNQQMLGRLNRKGQKKRVLLYKIMARETLDDPQADTLLAKELSMRASMKKEEL